MAWPVHIVKEQLTFFSARLFEYTISIRFGPVMRTAWPRSAGGAVPGLFFQLWNFACSDTPLTLTPQVDGNSIGHGGLEERPGE